MKFLLFILAFLSVSCQPKITPELKEAWTVVNSQEDIYGTYNSLVSQSIEISQMMSETPVQEQTFNYQISQLQAEIRQEEQRVLSIQSKIEKASEQEINVLVKN